jgi:hypothetical protein
LIKDLDQGEKFVADNGYKTGGLYSVTPDEIQDERQKKRHSRVRARHEIINRRLKQFGALKNTFRHSLDKHGLVFGAVALITQLILRDESRPFEL